MAGSDAYKWQQPAWHQRYGSAYEAPTGTSSRKGFGLSMPATSNQTSSGSTLNGPLGQQLSYMQNNTANSRINQYHGTQRNQGGSGENVHNMGASRTGPSKSTLFKTMQSGLANVQNPYGNDYGKGLLGGMAGNINKGFANTTTNLREQMAERGLSQSAISGIETQGLMSANIARDGLLAQAKNTVATEVAEKSADFEMRKAQAMDNFNMARATRDLDAARQAVDQFIAMAQNDRAQSEQPYRMGILQTQAEYAPRMAEVGYQRGLLGNQDMAGQVSYNEQARPLQLQELRDTAYRNGISFEQAQDAERQRQEMAPWAAAGPFIAAAAKYTVGGALSLFPPTAPLGLAMLGGSLVSDIGGAMQQGNTGRGLAV